jgi:hypothetical protein
LLGSEEHKARPDVTDDSGFWLRVEAKDAGSAETWRTQHLRPLRRVRDLHGRDDAPCAGLVRLVYADAREEKEVGGNAGGDLRTHSGGEAIRAAAYQAL